ncbi:MAG: nucleotide sugar dehydrogenase [Armatimonadota bacterium]|nr:nucleotide sugar dehydrogenase [Armatimonadota bacterium]MDR7423050.1 nucleotide sugar dehydrogenase [Armatimonadota bacterium]MDR7454342.1 nucleotide sugar dehydrogenase [Armatimonadota bacterium]
MPGDATAPCVLDERIAAGTAVVGVIGLGYVGLPLALAYARRGFPVRGYDTDIDKIATLAAGRSYLRDVPAEAVRVEVAAGRFTAAADPAVLGECDAVFVCVPTPFTRQKEPDVRHIADAAREVARWGRSGQVVVLRSTSYPGTTEGVVRPALEAAGRAVGRDVFLAFAPERIDPGNTRYGVEDVPVVVGGCDPESTRLASALLARLGAPVVPVSSPAAAEMAKLLENVFRNVNIALVNQVAQLCERMGLDVWEIIEAAATKPYGFLPFRPGLVGGHCIPVDPYYLAWKAREHDFHMDFIELAARVNEEMPFYVVNRLLAALHDNGSTGRGRALVLGVAFKRDVDDARYSPALRVVELLQRRRMDVVYHDPYVPQVEVRGVRLVSQPLTDTLVASADCVLILTDHSCVDYAAVVRAARLVFDVRNATAAVCEGREKIVRL